MWYVAAGDIGGRIVDAASDAVQGDAAPSLAAQLAGGGVGLAGAGLAVGLLISIGSAGFIAKLLQARSMGVGCCQRHSSFACAAPPAEALRWRRQEALAEGEAADAAADRQLQADTEYAEGGKPLGTSSQPDKHALSNIGSTEGAKVPE